jgi:hypothetical protein
MMPRIPTVKPIAEQGTALDRRRELGPEPPLILAGHVEELEPFGARRFVRLTPAAAASGSALSRFAGLDFEVMTGESFGWAELLNDGLYVTAPELAGEDQYYRALPRSHGYRDGLDAPPRGKRARRPIPLDVIGMPVPALIRLARRRGIVIGYAADGSIRLRAPRGAGLELLILLERARPFLEAEHRGTPLRCAWGEHDGEPPIAAFVVWPGIACCDPAAHELKPEPKPTGIRRLVASLKGKPA